jgi:hypothetical protein
MKIALDYDRTYTEDPGLWAAFIKIAADRGHVVKIVTMRRPDERITNVPVEVIYTSRKAKASATQADVWIDDSPHWIYQDAA